MKAVTVVFDYGKENAYHRLVKVLEHTWQENAGIPLEVHRIKAPEVGRRHRSFYSNTRKLEIWQERFDQDTIFVDADMLCLRDPSIGFDMIDDVGITDRSGNFPINGGVMFMKYTQRGREFMDRFQEINDRMLVEKDFHKKWQAKYAGINQSAIGYLIENEFQDYDLLPEKFNLCDGWDSWRGAYLIHVKGNLRIWCLRRRYRSRQRNPYDDLILYWRGIEEKLG